MEKLRKLEVTNIIEPIILVNYRTREGLNCKINSGSHLITENKRLKVSHIKVSLDIIAKQWGLKLSNLKDFKTAMRILKNSVNKN